MARTRPDLDVPLVAPAERPGAARGWSRPRVLIAGGVIGVVLLVLVAIVVLGGALGPPPTVAGPPALFATEASSGIDHVYDGPWPFVVGGGVAVFDCDDDRFPDLFLAGGTNPARLYRNESEVGAALRFSPIPSAETDLANVTGAYPLDIDGDGEIDLAVLRNGENIILRGLGDCRFERANDALGLDGGAAMTTAFSATWEGETGLPTLALGNYGGIAADGDWDLTCRDGELFRPRPGEPRYADPVPLAPSWCTLSMLFSDWDRSGRRDLRVSNDRHYYSDTSDGEEQLWRIEPGAAPRLYGRGDGWGRLRLWGMGIASQDLTGDGYPEVYLTSQADNKLQSLADGPGQPAYDDIALRRGVTAHMPFTGGDKLPSTGWHDEFADVNNDGFMDLLVTKGNVDEVPDYAMKDPTNLFLGQVDGTFIESADLAGILNYERARGAALADLNLDGLLDLVLANRRAPAKVWRNVGVGTADAARPMGNWVAIKPVQDGPNRDAIGSWISVRAGDRSTEREVTVGGGHGGGQLGPIHFGLGPADRAEVRVQWPDGEVGPWLPVTAGSFYDIERGATEARPWPSPAP